MGFDSSLHPRGHGGKFIPKAAHGVHAGSIPKPKSSKGSGKKRGTGKEGLKANVVPYARVNKRSQTIGVNAGTRIPGTHRRVVGGAYLRLESTKNKTVADRFVAKHVKRAFPTGTKRAKVVSSVKHNVTIGSPLARGSVKGHQVRLGTSRGAGPTVIIRRGKHKTPAVKSAKGVNSYNKSINKISSGRAALKTKRSRPQRRTAARKRK